METTRDYSAFIPRQYLDEYYAEVLPESRDLLKFLVRACRNLPSNQLALDFGSGPTLYTLIVAAGWTEEIHFSDYSQANLSEVNRWLQRHPDAFDWHEYTRTVLDLEGRDTSLATIAQREDEIRRKVKQVTRCDATSKSPLGPDAHPYDVLITNLCLEAAATSYEQWQQCVHNVTSLIKPGGKLVMSAVKGANAYSVGEAIFPVIPIFESDVFNVLIEAGFVKESIQIEWAHADHPVHPYQGLMFVTATKAQPVQPQWQLESQPEWLAQDQQSE